MNAGLLFVLMALALGDAAVVRTWTDNTGKFSVEAELIEVRDTEVVLKRTNGNLITVPLPRLSDNDRNFLDAVSRSAPEPKPASSPPPQDGHFTTSSGEDVENHARSSPTPDRSSQAVERLFLFRLLEELYGAVPHEVTDPDVFAAAVRELRAEALRLQQHIRDNNVSTELEQLFKDFIDCLEAYNRFLAGIGAIDESIARQTLEDEAAAGARGVLAGGTVARIAIESDATDLQTAAAALIAGGVTYLWNSWAAREGRDRSYQEEVGRRARQLDDKFNAAVGRAKNVALELAELHGWEKAEVSFSSLSAAHIDRVQRLMDRGDLEGLSRWMEQQVTLRPRDPFSRLDRNAIAGLLAIDRREGSAAIIGHVQDCSDAANLIPTSPIYDDYRLRCVSLGALLALAGRRAEVEQGLAPLGSTELSWCAVGLFRRVIERNPEDGELRVLYAMALLANNDVAAAVDVADDVLVTSRQYQDDPTFAYFYARLMSRRESYDSAMEWLEHAIRVGCWDVEQLKKDTDLELLRRQRAQRFREATAVKFVAEVDYGFIWNDVLVTNQSSFPFTNVVLQLQVKQTGQSARVIRLETGLIMPGASHRWEAVRSIPSGANLSASIACDQGAAHYPPTAGSGFEWPRVQRSVP